ncbi:MAG: hypothetical protein U1F49_20530 [Rubrivivax sp.]
MFGSLGTVIYAWQLAPRLPAKLPPAASEAALATIGGAAASARALGGSAGAALLEAARDAFTVSMQAAAAVGADRRAGVRLHRAHPGRRPLTAAAQRQR